MRQRIGQIQAGRLGPMLKEMVRQKLGATCQQEILLKQECDRAEAMARGVSDQLAQSTARTRRHRAPQLGRRPARQARHASTATRKGPAFSWSRLNEPKKATAPVSPDAARVFLLALVAGTVIGLMAVYVLDILDDRFRSLEEMQRQLGRPCWRWSGRLDVAGGRRPGNAANVYAQPDAAESEAFRTLRTALVAGPRGALADRHLQRRAGRRQDHRPGQPGRGLRPVGQADAPRSTPTCGGPGLTADAGHCAAPAACRTSFAAHDDVADDGDLRTRGLGIDGLDVLPSGPRPTNPAELLASARFSELLGLGRDASTTTSSSTARPPWPPATPP